MDRRLTVSIAVAAPVAAAGIACAVVLLAPRDKPVEATPATMEHCQRAAELLYEVTWAAACAKTADDSNDCTLPDEQAAKVNAILATEEARCLAAEAQAHANQ